MSRQIFGSNKQVIKIKGKGYICTIEFDYSCTYCQNPWEALTINDSSHLGKLFLAALIEKFGTSNVETENQILIWEFPDALN